MTRAWPSLLLVPIAVGVLASACSDPAKDKATSALGPSGECGDTSQKCPGASPSFGKDVFPIIQAKCNDCHVGGAGKPWPLDNWEDIAHWKNPLFHELTACTMPPADAGNQLTVEERKTILEWVACGTPADDASAP